MNIEKIDILKPLTDHIVVSNTILSEDYDEMMSWEDLVLWCDSYISNVLNPHITENDRAINLIIDWFNNLDIQEEVDKKLEEMSESGKLQEIMENYNGKIGDLEDLDVTANNVVEALNIINNIASNVIYIGDVSNLLTTYKNNLVGAINEIYLSLQQKIDKVTGKGLSTNDFTDEYKEIIDDLEVDLSNKVDKIEGKGLSTNDFTNAEKTKLANLENYDDSDIIEDITELQGEIVLKQKVITYGTSDPTGGINGDIYIKYTA